jgi:hypothetical protein
MLRTAGTVRAVRHAEGGDRGASSTYRIMVGRSAGVTGPFLDRAGVY